MSMSRRSLVLVLVLCAPVWGQRTTDRSARELLIEATCSVVVEPVDRKEVGKVKVVEVLRGGSIKVGDVLDGAQLAALLTEEQGPDWPNLAQAVLFGTPGGKAGVAFELLATGARLVSKSGKVWQMASRNGGGFRLVQRPAITWDRLLGRLHADVAELTALEAIRQQSEGIRRNQAILSWLERHPPGKLAPAPATATEPLPGEDLADSGWGTFETEPVRWILRTGLAEDSWAALALYARLHEGGLVGRECHPFATPEGRALLLEKLKDERLLGGDALRALKMLGWAETYPKGPVPEVTFAQVLGEAEQERLLKEVRPLLARQDARWKQAAAQALVALVAARETPEKTRQEVTADVEAQYKGSKAGNLRNALSRALFDLSPQGRVPLALLLDLGKRDHKVYFWLGVYPEGSVVKETPTLLIEKVLPMDKVEKALEVPLPATVPPDWATGWDTRKPLFVEVSVARLPAGNTYRMTVSGVVGPDKMKFASEPRTFQVQPSPLPNQQGSPRIVLDEE
jgi:hypothetical protein